MARWLITGGCGFIGRNLIGRLLVDSATTVRIVDDLSSGTREGLADPRVEIIVGNIADAALAQRAAIGIDVVVHLAANTGVAPSIADPRADCMTNVIGTLNYLEACRLMGVPRFIFASSGAALGDRAPPLHEELPARPVSPYGAGKLAGEAYCSAYRRSFGIDTVALRFGNCYGPRSSRKTSIVAKFIRQAIAGEAWEIYGDGDQTRDFIYVDDVIDAIMRAAAADGVGGELFQISTGVETTVLGLAQRLKTALAAHRVDPPEITMKKPRAGDVRQNYSDTRKARVGLDWQAKVPLEEGLDRTVRWFLESPTR
jgi:UDP-glucose 4-epimerase